LSRHLKPCNQIIISIQSLSTPQSSACDGITSTGTTQRTVYKYDDLYRLIDACTSANQTLIRDYHYNYDLSGNRLDAISNDYAANTTTANHYTYNLANQITSSSLNGGAAVSYLYDLNGNLTNDGANTYSYDAANRLTSVLNIATSQSVTFAYNGMGDRYHRSVAGVQTTYLLDLTSSLTQVLTENTNGIETRYLLGLDVIGQQVDKQWSYFGYDGLSSVRQLTDAPGALTFATQYDPYGQPIAPSGVPTSALGFTGEQTTSTGLVYLRARYINRTIETSLIQLE
jgi:YD repeat-containing protein